MAEKNEQDRPAPEGLPEIKSASRKDWKVYTRKERDLLTLIQGKKSAAEASKKMDDLLVGIVEIAGKSDAETLTKEQLKPLMNLIEQTGKALMAGEEERLASIKANDDLVEAQEELLRKVYPETDLDELTNEAWLYLFQRTRAKSIGDELGN